MWVKWLKQKFLCDIVENWLWIIQKGGHWVRAKQKSGSMAESELKKEVNVTTYPRHEF